MSTPSTAFASASEIFEQKSLDPLGAEELDADVPPWLVAVVVGPFPAVDAAAVVAVVVVLSLAFVPELDPQAGANAATTNTVAAIRFLVACPRKVFMPCMMRDSTPIARAAPGVRRGVLTRMGDFRADVPRLPR